MNVFLPDGSEMALPEGATGRTLAEAIGPRLAKAALGVTINGTTRDLDTPLSEGDQVAVVTAQSEEGLSLLRHSASHVMAEAVTKVFPGTKVAIGPSIKDGFYYDFDFPEPISETDLARFEEEIGRSVKAAHPFQRREVSRDARPHEHRLHQAPAGRSAEAVSPQPMPPTYTQPSPTATDAIQQLGHSGFFATGDSQRSTTFGCAGSAQSTAKRPLWVAAQNTMSEFALVRAVHMSSPRS